eukprot:2319311-Alexandrium_andersonii.AAC.1
MAAPRASSGVAPLATTAPLDDDAPGPCTKVRHRRNGAAQTNGPNHPGRRSRPLRRRHLWIRSKRLFHVMRSTRGI